MAAEQKAKIEALKKKQKIKQKKKKKPQKSSRKKAAEDTIAQEVKEAAEAQQEADKLKKSRRSSSKAQQEAEEANQTYIDRYENIYSEFEEFLKKNEKIEEEKNSYIKNKIDLMNDSEKIATELKNLGSKKTGEKIVLTPTEIKDANNYFIEKILNPLNNINFKLMKKI